MGLISNLLQFGSIPGSVAPTSSFTQLVSSLANEYKKNKNKKKGKKHTC